MISFYIAIFPPKTYLSYTILLIGDINSIININIITRHFVRRSSYMLCNNGVLKNWIQLDVNSSTDKLLLKQKYKQLFYTPI
jgi:hypothetical protein